MNELPDTGHFGPDARDLIQKANQEGWVLQLVLELKKARPLRSDVPDYGPAFTLDVAEGLPDSRSLEAILALANESKNAAVWVKDLQQAMSRVCRIEMGGRSYGTGFLVGPRAVLTNYHVIRECLGGSSHFPEDLPVGLSVRFDFHGTGERGDGARCELDDEDWLIDALPPSAMDDQCDPKLGLPGREELDFALLRVARSQEKKRGFLAPAKLRPKPGDPLFILHHPGEKPMQLSLDTKAVTESTGSDRGFVTEPTRCRARLARLVSQPTSSSSRCTRARIPVHRGGTTKAFLSHRSRWPWRSAGSRIRRRCTLSPGWIRGAGILSDAGSTRPF